jgi:hypothetical protein
MHENVRATGVRPLVLGMTAYAVLVVIAVVLPNAIQHWSRLDEFEGNVEASIYVVRA